RGSMITGKSTHNQRIERLWRDVWDGVLALYYEIFNFMEEKGILDSLSTIDITALHFVFLPLINEKLDAWKSAWAKHRIRTIRTSPIRLWASGQLNCPVDVHLTEEDTRPIFEAPIADVLTEQLKTT
ncbi:hypothetical protein, partial [Acinetobacter baumannii]|uniref:hypothetical protein n=1 Tax=Acinetobacter baumannii TaxID=470 RepID=UPI001C069499